jgi:hypothetical protein
MSVLALALGVHSSAAVPRPSGSSLMPLRCVLGWLGYSGGPPTTSQEQVDGVLSAAA